MSESPSNLMTDDAFDSAMVGACFRTAAAVGWSGLRIAEAARNANLSLARARSRFPSRQVLLVRFGRLADAAALDEASNEGNVRDRLFGLLMRRLDVFQNNREGVLSLLSALPTRPRTTLFLGVLTLRSMRWMLEAAGVDTGGPLGRLRVKGLTAVWLWTLRAWRGDETTDLAPTMAALDQALQRAERYAGWLPGALHTTETPEAPAEEPESAPPETPQSRDVPPGEQDNEPPAPA